MPQNDNRYTVDEICDQFRNCEHLDPEFKSIVLTRLNAIAQSMYNAAHEPEKTMTSHSDTWGDTWVEEHNRTVTLYQLFHD